MRWRELHRAAAIRLGSGREARWLVEEAAVAPWPAALDEAVTERAATFFADRVARREAGEPLQYVLGHWAFRRLDVLVDRRVLIPRPETEVTVDVALSALGPAPAEVTIADLGTGSGVIALALATERPGATVWATDVSPAALDVARANLAGVAGRAATRVRMVQGHWWDALPAELAGGLDLVVSNPPYVTTAEMVGLDPVIVGWEPPTALEAGPHGLEDVAVIAGGAPRWLRPGGSLVVEIAPHQATRATALAIAAGLMDAVVHPDLAGRPRVLLARRG